MTTMHPDEREVLHEELKDPSTMAGFNEKHGYWSEAKRKFVPKPGRGFHAADIYKAAEELRKEGNSSHDPIYENSKKNKCS